MPISFPKARDFVYSSGSLLERALFGHLFEGHAPDHLHDCLRAYRNPDGGFGHGLEHDISCPTSHPLALEFLLAMQRDTGFPIGDLLDGAAAWVETNQNEDGSLRNPPELHDYPHAPWWAQGGQSAPDAIVGHLTRLGLVTPALAATTRRWVQSNLTLESIAANGWLFMAYHAYDYFMNVPDAPDVERARAATIANIVALAATLPPNQAPSLFVFAPTPDSPVARALPPEVLRQHLDTFAAGQQEDGGWRDEHNLPQWWPYQTITALKVLRAYDRW